MADVFSKESMLKSAEAEQCLLGAMMLSADIVPDVLSKVQDTDFYTQTNRAIYQAMQEMTLNKIPIESVTLVEHLKESGNLERVGGAMGVMSILGANYTSKNYDYYVDIVLSYSKRRQMLELAKKLASKATDLSETAGLDEIQAAIAELAMVRLEDVKDMTSEVVSFVEEVGTRASEGFGGVLSGYEEIDKLMRGWKPAQLLILAARPAMGKTALALNFAVNACSAGKSVAVFSLEMPKYDLIARMIAYTKSVNLGKLQQPSELSEDEYSRTFAGADRLASFNLHLFDGNVASPNDIITTCKAVQARYGLDLVIVDYLQLLTSGGKYEGNRVQEVSYISRQLKMLAQNLKIPVLALSQLSRALESRNDKRPLLSDLRESGGIEQDADAVMMLYRDSVYTHDKSDKSAELSIVKNRNGETGTVNLDYYGEFTKFVPASGFYARHEVSANNIPY